VGRILVDVIADGGPRQRGVRVATTRVDDS
jgi:hypothetical protein